MFTLSSREFTNGEAIPVKFSQEGSNISPTLEWHSIPGGTMELALIVEDPDAPMKEPYVHWVIYGLDPALQGLHEDIPKKGHLKAPPLKQGLNSAGEVGYVGPLPPEGHGWHRYQFQMFALSEPLHLKPGAEVHELRKAMKGKILDQATLTGRYIRGPEPRRSHAQAEQPRP